MDLAKLWKTGALLQIGAEGVSGLCHLRSHHSIAITLVRILRKKILVILLAHPESSGRSDFGDDPAIPELRRPVASSLKQFPLDIRVIKHRRTILGSDVIALAIELPRIMNREENIQDDIGRNHRFVKDYAGNFSVTGVAIADPLVARIMQRPAHVADLNIFDTAKLHVAAVKAPEAASAKNETHHVASLNLPRRKTELSMVSKRNPTIGAVFALLGALLFGLNASTSKVIIQSGVDPGVLVLYRSFATAALAALVLLATKPKAFRVSRREVPSLLVFGIVGVGLMQWSYSQAVANLQVGLALLIEYTAIIWVPLASLVIFKEHLKRRIWLAIVLVLVGLAIVANPVGQSINPVGILYAFMAAVFLTVYFIMGERTQKSRDTFSTLFYTMFISGALWLVFSPWMSFELGTLSEPVSLQGNLQSIEVPLWALLIMIGIFGSFVPMALSYRALHHLSATGVGVSSTSETVFAFGFGLLWLGEAVSGTQIIGSVLVLAGIILAQTARART